MIPGLDVELVGGRQVSVFVGTLCGDIYRAYEAKSNVGKSTNSTYHVHGNIMT